MTAPKNSDNSSQSFGFTEIFIRRPVLATVLSLIIILIGLVTMSRLNLREYPNVSFPKVSVIIQLEGASPEIIETLITKKLESTLSGIEGVETIVSQSMIGESRISLMFDNGRRIDDAASDVRDRIARVRDTLPRGITDPRIRKADADAVSVVDLALTSSEHTPEEMADYIQKYLINQFEALPGVSSAEVFGGGMFEMHVMLDPVKLASYQLSPEDVVVAVKRQNVQKPAGQLRMKDRDIIVTTTAALKTEDDFRDISLVEKDGGLVRLKDVAQVVLKAEDRRNKIRFNQLPSVSLSIVKQSVANPLDIARGLEKLLPKISENLPRGMKIHVAYDSTVFIEESINEVKRTIFEATFLVIVVVLLTLGSLRAVWIPAVTIPISLIGTFALMYLLGFTINILTLLALVLAIGLVVDDAIVVLENVYRYIEKGMKPLPAAIKGASEVRFAVIAMTLTLAAVYAPIALTPGLVGKLFTEFAITLAGAVLISGFIAITLSPMMCAKILRVHDAGSVEKKTIISKAIAWVDRVFDKTSVYYASFLGRTLLKPGIVLLSAVILSTMSFGLSTLLKSELNPTQDTGIIASRISPPFGANLAYVDKYMIQAEEIVRAIPEVKSILAQSQTPGEPTLRVMLGTVNERTRSSETIATELNEQMMKITGLDIRMSPRSSGVIPNSANPFQIVLQSSKPYKELVEIADNFSRHLMRNKNLMQVVPDIIPEGQQFTVDVDRDKAAALGVDVSTVSEVLDTAISGRIADHFQRDGKRYPVRVELDDDFRATPEDLSSIFLRSIRKQTSGDTDQDRMIPLSELIKVTKTTSQTEIRHYGGVRSVSIFGRIRPGGSLGEAIDDVRVLAKEHLPDNVLYDFAGESRRYLDEQSSIVLVYGMALLFIFLILAAQYESYIDPLIILFSVPLSLSGGVLFLYVFGGTLNLYSQIGFVTLIGLITKHAILIVDFANHQVHEEGIHPFPAVIDAACLRLRPILMTTFAMVVGALPLMFATGNGFEVRRQIGMVIVGGMSIGTVCTLVVVPAFYVIVKKWLLARA
ncbi:MAG: efflux RND transporter permease subunit [Alphaproteobacteria bacterium]|nr:MAG: efflux RND transporter permease subunit [Alphaproteobacteria bacterium]